MKLETKYAGVVDIRDDQIISLKDGFFGFEAYHDFAKFDSDTPPFIWVESIIKGGPSFIAIDPFIFRPDYEIELEDDVVEELEIRSPADVLIYALVTITGEGRPITANLQGPLIVNKKNRRAKQVVAGGKWKTKHDIMAESIGMGDNKC